jgi:hypothetical protein
MRPANAAELRRGEIAHRQHGRQVVACHRLRGAGYLLVGATLLLSLLLLWTLARG